MEAEVSSEAGKLIGFILDSGSMQLQAYVSYTNILSLSKRDSATRSDNPASGSISSAVQYTTPE